MKKSFFLLTAALVAMFSFSACSDDKDDNPSKPPSGGNNASIIGCKVSGVCAPVLEEELCALMPGGVVDNSCTFKGCEAQGTCTPMETSVVQQGCDMISGTVINSCSVVYCKTGDQCSKQYEYLCVGGEIVSSCDNAGGGPNQGGGSSSSGGSGNGPSSPSSNVQAACNYPQVYWQSILLGGACIEISGASTASVSEFRADCTTRNEFLGVGTPTSSCPGGTRLECIDSEDGETWTTYFYGDLMEDGCD